MNWKVPYSRLTCVVLAACLTGCNSNLKQVEKQQKETRRELEALGETMLGQTVPQIGFMTVPQWAAPYPRRDKTNEPRWVQVDLGSVQTVDRVAFIPVQMDWQRVTGPNNKFPHRFKVEVAEDAGFSAPHVLGDFTKDDYPNPGITPVVLEGKDIKGRFVKFTVFEPEAFALAEIMVISGKRNIAIGCPVTSSLGASLAPRWDLKNLVDGLTPLGPPILIEEQDVDGIYTGPNEDGSPLWFQMDFGREVEIEELRLYAAHGTRGIDIPGYRFPPGIMLKRSAEADFSNSEMVYDSGRLPNPSNNPVYIPLKNLKTRYLRIELAPYEIAGGERRFGFAEIEVYSGGENIAPTANLTSSGEPHEPRKSIPISELVDGYTSYGKIIELPEWLDNWVKRKEYTERLNKLNIEQVALLDAVRVRQWILLLGGGVLFAGGIVMIALHTRRARRLELNQFRLRLAQDLHDEVGSNLAAIGIISETVAGRTEPPIKGQLETVQRITRETTEAIREMLWVMGTRQDLKLDLMAHIRLAAIRMLPRSEIVWTESLEEVPADWSAEKKRQLFLFFKEALTNIVRHSNAKTVTFSAYIENGWFELRIEDNGEGFCVEKAKGGVGLKSLNDRAKRIGGTMTLESSPGNGTRLLVRVPARK